MYYSEKLINGIWHYKTSPNMDWKPMSITQLTNKIATQERELNKLRISCVTQRFNADEPEKMAEWLHNNYEEIALNNGWKTQEDCQVPFCDLPYENKETMIELCDRFLNVG